MNEHENCDNCNYCGTKFVCPKCNCRAGILEGLKMAYKDMSDYYNKYSSEFAHHDTGGAMLTMVDDLIKQYSGDE